METQTAMGHRKRLIPGKDIPRRKDFGDKRFYTFLTGVKKWLRGRIADFSKGV